MAPGTATTGRRSAPASPAARRRVRIRRLALPAAISILAAAGTYAGMGVQSTGPPRGMQLVWTIVALFTSAVFAFMTTLAGGYALTAWRHDHRDQTLPLDGPTDRPASTRVPVWGVPPRNAYFTGRAPLLRQLAGALGPRPDHPDGPTRSCAIVGLGGVGKTTLAIEYAHHVRRDFDVVWWVRAESGASIIEDLTVLAAVLDGDRHELTDPAGLAVRLQRGLAQAGRWLLVFDNAEEPHLVRGFWPVGEGAILVTSRRSTWDGLIDTVVAADVFDRDDAVALLQRSTRETDDASASALAEALGCLPLAISQAGAYVSKTGTSMRHYLDLLDERMDAVLGAGRVGDYPGTVATTWAVSMDAAAAQAVGARELLHLCAFLGASGVPRVLIRRHAAALPEPLGSAAADPVSFDLAVAAQTQYSLLAADQDQLSMHRLVQSAVRASLAPPTRALWTNAAAALLAAAFPRDIGDSDQWAACGQLVPHVLGVAGHSAQLDLHDETTAELLVRAGRYLVERGLFGTATELFRQAVGILGSVGDSDADLGHAHRWLALALYREAKLPESLEHAQTALTIHRASAPAESGAIIDDLVQVGRIYREMSRQSEAMAALDDARGRAARDFGPTDERLVAVLRELGNTYRVAGRPGAARAALEQAVVVASAQPRNDATLAGLRYILAVACRDTGDLATAREHLLHAIAFYRMAHGEGSGPQLRAEQSLSVTLCAAGEPEEALRLADGAATGLAAAYGTTDHPDVAEAMSSKGDALNALGRPEEADEVLRAAVRVYTERYGADHPYLVSPLVSLATSQRLAGSGEAEVTIRHASSIVETSLTTTHPLYAKVLIEMSRQRAQRGDQVEAEQLADRAREILAEAVTA